MRALIYARVSEDPRGQGRSVDEQEDECRAWATREGWDVVQAIRETGSASRYARSTRARQKWPDVTAALAGGGVDILLTWENSRAARDLTAYADLRDLCARHSVMWGYSGTVYNLADRSDRFRTGLDALMSEDESARTSERVRRASRARALAGAPHGKLPFGHRREYDSATGALLRQLPDEETAPIVQEIFTRLNAGESLYGIAADLTRRGIPNPRPPRTARPAAGAAWLPSTVKRIAANPTHAGLRIHRGEVVGDAAWPALVGRDVFDRVQAILANPDRMTRTGDSRARWLLTGIARCGAAAADRDGLCGGPLRVITNRGTKSYTCPWCMRVNRVVATVDEHVTERLLALLSTFDLAATDDQGAEVAAARAGLDGLRARLEAFIDAAADGGPDALSPRALARVESRLRPQIRAAEEKLLRLMAPSRLSRVDLSNPAGWWERATIEERRDLLRAAVTVTIYPAGRGRRTFDPSLVAVAPTW